MRNFKKYESTRTFFLGGVNTLEMDTEPNFELYHYASDWVIGLYAQHYKNEISRWLIIEKSIIRVVSGAKKTFKIKEGKGIVVHDFKYDHNSDFDKISNTVPYGFSLLDDTLEGGQEEGLTMLIGEPGVGKTAIAEGLAQRVINGDVPESLKNRQLISLDMGSLIAGAKYRGEFEDRLRGVLREVTESNGQIVLFIDELHTVVGAGGTTQRRPFVVGRRQ